MLKRMFLSFLLCVAPAASGPARAEAGGRLYTIAVTVRAEHQPDYTARAEGGPGRELPILSSTYPPQKRLWGRAWVSELPSGLYVLTYEMSYRQEDGVIDQFKGGLPAASSTNSITVDHGNARLMIRVNRG
jgi:hypothetical protein